VRIPGEVFDTVWASVTRNVGDYPVLQHCFERAWGEVAGNLEASTARSRLGSLMLWMASNTQLGITELIQDSILLTLENVQS
jgi:hypothetical protein